MKKLYFILGFFLLAGFSFSVTAAAASDNATMDFAKVIDDSALVMLIIEPESESILYANNAAASFYGYTKGELTSMKILQLNIMSPEQINAERQSSASENRHYFLFKHRLANGEIRTAEVYSYPTEYNGKRVLFSVIYDVTEKTMLEEKQQRITVTVGIAGVGVLLVLLYLLVNLKRKSRSLAKANKALENSNELRETFIDAGTSLIYLKDEHLKYVFVNKALKDFFNLSYDEIIGHDDSSFMEPELAQLCTQAAQDALDQHTSIIRTTSWNNQYFRTINFPVRMLNGSFGVGAYISDVTEEYKQQQNCERMLSGNELLLDVLGRSFSSKQEQLDYALHGLLKLSQSQYGYIYFYDEEKEEFTLNSCTQSVMEECSVHGEPKVYKLADTGIWGEVVRQRRPIIVNDLDAPNPLKKGYPKGHVALKRFISVPVFIDDKIVAVVGFGNKLTDYNETDAYEMTMLMSGVWERCAAQRIDGNAFL